jgi:hypothetical protein
MLDQSLWCQNHLFLRFLLLNKLDRTALKLMSSSIFIFFKVIFHFSFFRSFSIFSGGRLSSWVEIRLHTENQLPRLPQSALKVPGWWWLVHNHYQEKLQLMLTLSWAVTIIVPSSLPWSCNDLLSLNSSSSKVTFGQNPHPLFEFGFYLTIWFWIFWSNWSNWYPLDHSP